MKANLWNLYTSKNIQPKPGDVVININPDDIAATIDGGSGKYKLGLFQISGSNYEPFFKDEIEAGIAVGTFVGHRSLSEEGMETVYQNLPRFRNHITASGSTKVYAYTTGAVRYGIEEEPEQCEEFIECSQELLGYTLNNISGTFEAKLLLMSAKALHPDTDALVGGVGGSTFEAGLIHQSDGFSHAIETGLGSHTALAEHAALPHRSIREIINRELKPLESLMTTCRRQPLPFIPAGSVFRRNTRLLMRQTIPQLPLFVPFVSNVRIDSKAVMPILAEWADMSSKQLQRYIRPPLDNDERRLWDRKFANYADRMPLAAQAMYEIMRRANSSALISSTASTRAGVIYALRNNIDISHITSSPVSSKPHASPSRSEQAPHASVPAPNGQTAPAASLA